MKRQSPVKFSCNDKLVEKNTWHFFTIIPLWHRDMHTYLLFAQFFVALQ